MLSFSFITYKLIGGPVMIQGYARYICSLSDSEAVDVAPFCLTSMVNTSGPLKFC